MAKAGLFDRRRPDEPLLYSIPAHRSFADAMATGLIREFGNDPMVLAKGRILLPNNRAVRTLTNAFVRVSGGGLVLPRLVPIGDPDLGDRLGGALDPINLAADIPPAIDPLERQLMLARLLRSEGESAAEAIRLAAELARTLDALAVEEVPPQRLAEAVDTSPELAAHWQAALARFRAILERWPAILAERGVIDLADRRGRTLRTMAERWKEQAPEGFTIAAGITTSAPAVAALLHCVARMEWGAVVLPALAAARVMPDEEWEALGPDEEGHAEETHPQYHLKRLLKRIGASRGEVRPWRHGGRSASAAVRGRAVAQAMVAAAFSDKWNELPPPERRLSGIRVAVLPDPASEAQAIAIALREAIETPGQTAALVTPDRGLAARVAAHLRRWGIEADDSAGQPLSRTTAGALLLGIAALLAEGPAPVPLLALLKHPSVGGEGEQRLAWLEQVRRFDLALRGPRPKPGLAGLDEHFEDRNDGEKLAWKFLRSVVQQVDQPMDNIDLSSLAMRLREIAQSWCGDRAWQGPDGRMVAELLTQLEESADARVTGMDADDFVPLLRQLMDAMPVRRPYGGHPRILIWGLIEARLQQADLMVLGGMNEAVWPALPSPDPWLAPQIRRTLGLPGQEYRIGLSSHDFMCALGAPRVLLTRARRDSRSPTIASRFLLRLEAMTGGMTRDQRLERLTQALDAAPYEPAKEPAPSPPKDARPRKIAVTDVDRLKADPFAFYARAILKLGKLEPVDADRSAAWKGTAVHDVLEQWCREDQCDPAALKARAQAFMQDGGIHPMLKALWGPRLMEAIDWIVDESSIDRANGRYQVLAEEKGEADVAGVILYGRVDRIDRLADGRLAIIDYKLGQAPRPSAVREGFALQLALLSMIVERGGFSEKGVVGKAGAHEYWSLAKDKGKFGYRRSPDKDEGPEAFIARAYAQFESLAKEYLLGEEPFRAKLHPAYAPYEDYDQLMRLEEWYGRV